MTDPAPVHLCDDGRDRYFRDNMIAERRRWGVAVANESWDGNLLQ
jgi:hypothetical protein